MVKPMDVYNHQEPFLRTLTRNKETKRVRLIKHGEQVKSLWDEVRDPNNVYIVTDMTNKTTRTVKGDGVLESSPHTFYNEADAAEDAILFPDELVSPNRNVPFKEVSNAVTRLEDGYGVLSKYLAKRAKDSSHLPTKPSRSQDEDSDSDESWNTGDSFYDLDDDVPRTKPEEDFKDEDGEVTKHWRLPRLWEDRITKINEGQIDAKKKQILSNVGLLESSTGKVRRGPSDAEFARNLKTMDRMMLMEKDRGDGISLCPHHRFSCQRANMIRTYSLTRSISCWRPRARRPEEIRGNVRHRQGYLEPTRDRQQRCLALVCPGGVGMARGQSGLHQVHSGGDGALAPSIHQSRYPESVGLHGALLPGPRAVPTRDGIFRVGRGPAIPGIPSSRPAAARRHPAGHPH